MAGGSEVSKAVDLHHYKIITFILVLVTEKNGKFVVVLGLLHDGCVATAYPMHARCVSNVSAARDLTWIKTGVGKLRHNLPH